MIWDLELLSDVLSRKQKCNSKLCQHKIAGPSYADGINTNINEQTTDNRKHKKLRFYKTFWYWYKWTKREQTFPTTKFLVVILKTSFEKAQSKESAWKAYCSSLGTTIRPSLVCRSIFEFVWLWVSKNYRTWHSRWIRGPGEGPMSWAMSSKDQRKRRSWSWEPKYMAFGIIRFVFW